MTRPKATKRRAPEDAKAKLPSIEKPRSILNQQSEWGSGAARTCFGGYATEAASDPAILDKFPRNDTKNLHNFWAGD